MPIAGEPTSAKALVQLARDHGYLPRNRESSKLLNPADILRISTGRSAQEEVMKTMQINWLRAVLAGLADRFLTR